MLNLLPILAQAQPSEQEAMREVARKQGGSKDFWGGDVSLLLGAVLLVAAVIFFWAFFLRKRPKHAHGSLVMERAKKASPESVGSSGRRKRRKRRPDHPDNWGRNPTLDETGGLPPVRPEEPDAPADEAGEAPEPQR